MNTTTAFGLGMLFVLFCVLITLAMHLDNRADELRSELREREQQIKHLTGVLSIRYGAYKLDDEQ